MKAPSHRRQWLQAAASTSLLAVASPARSHETNDQHRLIHIFTKPLQHQSFEQVASLLQEWDVGGLEATVRKGGWIESAEALEKLPRLMDALRTVNRSGMILTTDINSASQVEIEQVLKTAAEQKVRYFRMAYYRYDLSKPLVPQLENFAKQAQGLATVCRQLQMTALYQNHAGATNVGGALWDLMEILREIPSREIAIALDIRHATIESAASWRSAYHRVSSQVGSIFAKDAIIDRGKIDDGPLGRSQKGRQLFDLIRQDHPAIPISLHMEYIDHRPAELQAQRIMAIAKDIATLKTWLR